MAELPDMDLFSAQVDDAIGGSPTPTANPLAAGTATGVAGLFLGGLGTLFKIGAEISQGRAAKRAYDLSADASNRAAADAAQRGLTRDLQVAMRGSVVVASQRVAQSAGGADVNVGGAKAAQDATLAVTELDRAAVRRNAALEAYGLRARAQQQHQEGEYAEEAAESAALGTFLGGIADIAKGAGPLIVGAA